MTPAKKPHEFWLYRETAILCENRSINIHDQHNFVRLVEHSAYMKAVNCLADIDEILHAIDCSDKIALIMAADNIKSRARACLKELGELDEKPE